MLVLILFFILIFYFISYLYEYSKRCSAPTKFRFSVRENLTFQNRFVQSYVGVDQFFFQLRRFQFTLVQRSTAETTNNKATVSE